MHETERDDWRPGVNEQFGALVKATRESRGLSQRRLAELLEEEGLKLDPSAITRIETGQREVKLREAVAISEIVGFDLLDISKSRKLNRAATVDRMVEELSEFAQRSRINIERLDGAIHDFRLADRDDLKSFVDELADMESMTETDLRAFYLRLIWPSIRSPWSSLIERCGHAASVIGLDKVQLATLIASTLQNEKSNAHPS